MSDQTEVQRLRAALHKITQIYDDPNLHDLTACHEMNRVAKEALSTTIEPTNAAKVKRIECPCCGCEINAPEKVGTEEWRHKYFGAE